LFEAHAGNESSQQREVLTAADGPADLRHSGKEVDPVAPGVTEAGWHDPHDRERDSVHQNRLAEDARISTQRALPELVRKNHDVRPAGLILVAGKRSSERRLDTHHPEVIRGYADHLEMRSLTTGEEVDPDSGRDREGVKSRRVVAEVLELGELDIALVPRASVR